MDYGNEWVREGATLSDKTARAEYGLTQDEIIAAIDAGRIKELEQSRAVLLAELAEQS